MKDRIIQLEPDFCMTRFVYKQIQPMIRIITDARAGGANITRGYKWNIKVTQIDCVSQRMEDVKAPDGCLQYFTDRRGTVNRCERLFCFQFSR